MVDTPAVALPDSLDTPILWAIVACEIGFWLLVVGGLAVRYGLRRPRLSRGILLLVPAVDVLLVVAVAIDLHRGSEVTTVHRLAGIYLGVTMAFGHSIIAWSDARFAHWFADGPSPPRPPRKGRAGMRYELLAFGQWLIAAVVAAALTEVLIATVANNTQEHDLRQIYPMLGVVTVIWLVTGPVWNLLSAGPDNSERR